MKHVIQRILKWSGLGLAGVIALLVLTVAVVLNTSFGGRATLRVLSRLPVDVSVADFQGRLASSFTLTGIVYRSEQLDANVDTLHVEWRPMGLMRKRLLIDRVLVAGVETIVRATGTEAETEAAPIDTTGSAVLELPVDIELGEIRVRRAGASIPGGIEVRNVELFATGRPNAYRAEIDATISGGEVPQTIVHMDAEGSLEHVVLERFHARLLDGSVTVSGRAAWAPDIEWDVAVAVDSIAPAPLLGDSVRYDGSITLRAATRGKFTDEGLRAFVRVDTLLGSLGEYTVSGRGELDARETHATITGFEFRWGDMRLAIDGDAQWSPTISWELALMADRITPSLFMPDP
ncbi:MAG: hypothetical protein IH969_05745, partial [Candidatus Krumholzibacteriota bacterium]|nr:hypothetical protein [Candidatus Krumholzibacteriota bacterium]